MGFWSIGWITAVTLAGRNIAIMFSSSDLSASMGLCAVQLSITMPLVANYFGQIISGLLNPLKHRGFADLPIIKGVNLCEPSALAHDTHFLYFRT